MFVDRESFSSYIDQPRRRLWETEKISLDEDPKGQDGTYST